MARNGGLKRFINAPGGITSAQAEDRANLHLEMLKPGALKEIDGALEALGSAVRTLPEGHADAAAREQIHQRAYAIASLAGTFGLAPLGRAAYLLCDLLDRFESAGAWDAGAVRVYFDAMRLLRDASSEAEKDRLLSGLERVVRRFESAHS